MNKAKNRAKNGKTVADPLAAKVAAAEKEVEIKRQNLQEAKSLVKRARKTLRKAKKEAKEMRKLLKKASKESAGKKKATLKTKSVGRKGTSRKADAERASAAPQALGGGPAVSN